MNQSNSLRVLVGEEVNAVCFVMDYLELHFNGPLIRCIADPELIVGEHSWRFPEPGSREKLCELIGSQLVDVVEEIGESIALTFEPEGVLRIPLDDMHRYSGEAVHFVPGDNRPIAVW